MSPDELQKLIEEAIPDATVDVTDLTGTADHFGVSVVSPAFAGLTLVQQHQLVYRAVGDHMNRAVHALRIHTKTP